MLLKEIPGEKVTYFSFDEVIDKSEGFNSLTPNGIPIHELILEKNCSVMLFRNINLAEDLWNGTILICRDFKQNVILAEIGTGEYRGKQIFLPRIPFIPLEGCVAIKCCVVNMNTIGKVDI
ncbi:uncharacterized protein LOC111394004 [Olea europaea var. sylvestris]|uniref:uncharacterized protein LOC111394004 n=1 Tax=Olea europaea var. sylvestris TaxID=158386 RepID=UPI000C1CE477|nr:uncharacterized protein LOC111394004 [Olea europaea var. sylvestris]